MKVRHLFLLASYACVPGTSAGTELTWTAATNTTWDRSSTANWSLPGGTATTFPDAGEVRFTDGVASGNVTVDITHGAVNPSAITFANDSTPYTLSGAAITGTGTLSKSGSGELTLLGSESYEGGTAVHAGTLKIGNGSSSGEIGRGPLTVDKDASVIIDRSGLLDYSDGSRLNTVSGAGSVILQGGGTLSVNPENTDYNKTWTHFNGSLHIRGGSELQTRGGLSKSIGSSNVTLGDASSSGTLAAKDGNGIWVNQIDLQGPDNWIINRSPAAAGGTYLTLAGAFTGGGKLTFHDATGSMSDPDRGFIIAGHADYMEAGARIEITAGTPVRVGGKWWTGLNPPPAGGVPPFPWHDVTVHNEGILTFSSESDVLVQGVISGGGSVRVGLADGSSAGQRVTIFQGQTYTGNTTVLNGTLILRDEVATPLVDVKPGATLEFQTLPGDLLLAGILGDPATYRSSRNVGGTLTLVAGATLYSELGRWPQQGGSQASLDSAVHAAAIHFEGTAAQPVKIALNARNLIDFHESNETLRLFSSDEAITGFDPAHAVVELSNFGAPNGGSGTWSLQLGTGGHSLDLVYAAGSVPDYDFWASAYPGFTDTAADADPDHDGFTNEFEYAFGLDPTVNSSRVFRLDDYANPTPALDMRMPFVEPGYPYYFRRDPARTGLEYVYQWSSDLSGEWTDISTEGDPYEILQYEAGTGRQKVIPQALTLDPEILARPRLFIRLVARPKTP